MRVTIVGCSGSVPGPASPASCYLVEADDADGRTWRVALDMGAGALGALQRFCDPRELDAVAITHLHPDHCADLASLHVYLKYHPDGPTTVPVYAPFGAAGRINQLRGETEPSEVLNPVVWQASGEVRIGPLHVTCEAVEHPVPAYALRIEGPSAEPARASAILTYSGDTDVCDGLDVAAAGADLFLCEASYLEEQDAPRGVHLTAAAAGAAAERAGVGRLLLTHIPPWTDCQRVLAEAAAHCDVDVSLARPGQHIEI
ncbi:MBL fold metallo-hydrolase [Demequina globuliformis]|uniref:MBL fold metallo-hydrolase n=1 Tax=Demequina globuliformis TaxID=676202 RepID=UPI0007867B93|nr:MBL fold metallo-hydrolase [Demequina globuliformis]